MSRRAYSAPARNIAALELRPEVGDKIIFVALECRELLSQDWLTVGLSRCERPILNAIKYEEQTGQPQLKACLGKENWEKWCLVDNLLADIVTQEIKYGDEFGYLESIAIAKNLFRLCPAGIIYPSMGTRLHGINICMTSEFSTRYLFPVTTHLYQVTKLTFDEMFPFQATRLASSRHISGDETIDWLEVKSDMDFEEFTTHICGPAWALQ